MSKSSQEANFKEYLEEIRDLKKVCSISFRDVEGMLTVIRGHIENGEVHHYQVVLKAGFTLEAGS